MKLQNNNLLGYNQETQNYYILNNNNWTLGSSDITCVSIGTDSTTVYCGIYNNTPYINSIDIYGNIKFLSPSGLPENYTNIVSIAAGNTNFVYGIINTSNIITIFNYIKGLWSSIPLTNLPVLTLSSSIFLGYDGTLFLILSGLLWYYNFSLQEWYKVCYNNIQLQLTNMLAMTSNYIWIVNVNATPSIDVYVNSSIINYNGTNIFQYTTFVGNIMAPESVLNNNLYITSSYDGNIYINCNNNMYIRDGLTLSNPQGTIFIKLPIIYNSTITFNNIYAGPSYSTIQTSNFPYYNIVNGYSVTGPNNISSYYTLNNIQNWDYVANTESISIGNQYNNIITSTGKQVYFINNFGYSVALNKSGLSSSSLTKFISSANVFDTSSNIYDIWCLGNDNYLYNYIYSSDITHGEWLQSSGPTSKILSKVNLGFDNSLWVIDTNNNVWYMNSNASWIDIIDLTSTPYTSNTISVNTIDSFLWGSYNNTVSLYNGLDIDTGYCTQTTIAGPVSNLNLIIPYSQSDIANTPEFWCCCNGIIFNYYNNTWNRYTENGNNPIIDRIVVNNLYDKPYIYGQSSTKYYSYNIKWDFINNIDCFTIINTGIITSYGSIITLYDFEGNIINYIPITGLPSNLKLIQISASNDGTVICCLVINSNIPTVYSYSAQSQSWTSLTLDNLSTITTLSVGVEDGSIWVVDVIPNSDPTQLIYSVLYYDNGIWTNAVDTNENIIFANQISVYNKSYFIAGILTFVTGTNIQNPPTIIFYSISDNNQYISNNVVLPNFTTYISYSQDDTLWCLSEGLVFERSDITPTTPTGTGWYLYSNTINNSFNINSDSDIITNNYPISQISVSPSLSYNKQSNFNIPFYSIILGYDSENYYIYKDNNWIPYGYDVDVISIGVDQNTIICSGQNIYIVNSLGKIYILSIQGLPEFTKFTSVVIGDINNIYGLLYENNENVYKYTFNGTLNSINEGTWIAISQETIINEPLISLYIGFDGSLWGINNNLSGNVLIYDDVNNTWVYQQYINNSTSVDIQSSQISVITSKSFWSVYDNNGVYYIYYYENNGQGFSQFVVQNPIIDDIINAYICTCYDGNVYLLINNIIFCRIYMTSYQPYGTSWKQISPDLTQIINYLTISPGSYYSGNINNNYIQPYYEAALIDMSLTVTLPIYTISVNVVPTTEMIWGLSSNGSLYTYNNYLGMWYFVSSFGYSSIDYGTYFYQVSIGVPPQSYIPTTTGQNICYANYSVGSSLYNTLGTINVTGYDDIDIFNNIIWNSSTTTIPVPIGNVSMGDSNNIWGVGLDNNIYNNKGTNGSWQLINFPTSTGVSYAKYISIGYDGTVMAIDINNYLYLYNSGIWSSPLTNVKLSQISVASKNYYWGVYTYNNIIQCVNYYNDSNNISNTLKVNAPIISNELISAYICACYNGTVWGLFNGILYRREGITTLNPEGVNWLLIANSINDNLISISVGAGPNTNSPNGTIDSSYYFPLIKPSNLNVYPYDTAIICKNTTNAYLYSITSLGSNYSSFSYNTLNNTLPTNTYILGLSDGLYYYWDWNINDWVYPNPYTENITDSEDNNTCNTCSISSDKDIIINYNNTVYVKNYNNDIDELSVVNLPSSFQFNSLSSPYTNYIWGTLKSFDNYLYNYNTTNLDWDSYQASTTITDASGIIQTVSVGYDNSIFVIVNQLDNEGNPLNVIYNFTVSSSTYTWGNPILSPSGDSIEATQISVANINYFWTVLNNDNIYTINLYINYSNATTYTTYSVDLPTTTIITSLVISLCYDGTLYCICNQILYIRVGISSLTPQGIKWVQLVQMNNTKNIISIISGPGESYITSNYNPPTIPDYKWKYYGSYYTYYLQVGVNSTQSSFSSYYLLSLFQNNTNTYSKTININSGGGNFINFITNIGDPGVSYIPSGTININIYMYVQSGSNLYINGILNIYYNGSTTPIKIGESNNVLLSYSNTYNILQLSFIVEEYTFTNSSQASIGLSLYASGLSGSSTIIISGGNSYPSSLITTIGTGQINCISKGCDGTILYCDNNLTYINSNKNWNVYNTNPSNIIFSNISVADINNIWGIGYNFTNSETKIYQNVNQSWISTTDQPELTPLSISVGFDGTIMCTTSADITWEYDINNSIWNPLDPVVNFAYITIGSKDYGWGILNNSIYFFNGKTVEYVPKPNTSNLSNSNISVSYDGTVWILLGGNLFTRIGITVKNPSGTNWQQINNPISVSNPSMLSLSANSGPNNYGYVSSSYIFPYYSYNPFVIWAVIKNGDVYIYNYNKWNKVVNNNNQNIKIVEISIGIDGSVWAISNNTTNNLYYRDGITALNLQGDNWLLLPNNLVFTSIYAYNNITLYGLTTINNIVYICCSNYSGSNWSLQPVYINNIYQIPISISFGYNGNIILIMSTGYGYTYNFISNEFIPIVNKNLVKVVIQDTDNTWYLQKSDNINIILYNNTTINSPNSNYTITDIDVSYDGKLFATCYNNDICYIYKFIGNPILSYSWILFYNSENSIITFTDISIISPIYPQFPAKILSSPINVSEIYIDSVVNPIIPIGEGVLEANYYYGTENWNGDGANPPTSSPSILSPESQYISDYKHTSFMFGICHSGGGSRASTMSLGISASLYNAGFLNFNYFSYIASNSGGGYTNFKLSYKPYPYDKYGNISRNLKVDTDVPVNINHMLGYYYQPNKITTENLNYSTYPTDTIAYGMTINANKWFSSLSSLINYWNWENKHLIPFGLSSNTDKPPWFFVTFDKISFEKFELNGVLYNEMIKIVSRCDKKSLSPKDNMPIHIAVTGQYLSPVGMGYLIQQQIYPNEYTSSSSGTYRTPGSNYQNNIGQPQYKGYNFKSDNIIFGATGYTNAGNGIINNPQFPYIIHGFADPNRDQDLSGISVQKYDITEIFTNNTILEGMYTSSSAAGTILQSYYGTIFPQFVGSYSSPNIDPYTTLTNSTLTGNIYSADGADIDNCGLIPLLQRKLTNIQINIANDTIFQKSCNISDIKYYFGTNRNQTIGSQVSKSLGLGILGAYSTGANILYGAYTEVFKTGISYLTGVQVDPKTALTLGIIEKIANINVNYRSCISVFPSSELEQLWNNLYDNLITYGVPMATFKHTFNPDIQAQIAYGFDDPFYGQYANRSISGSQQSSYSQYYPIITWNVLQAPSENITTQYNINLTLKKTAFWKRLTATGKGKSYTSIDSPKSTPWWIYTLLIQDIYDRHDNPSGYYCNFPYYDITNLVLPPYQINALSYYTSALSDYYIVPWLQNNAQPFNLFLTDANIIPTIYLKEDNISTTSNQLPYIINNSIYCPQLNLYLTNGSSTTNIGELIHTGNSVNINSSNWILSYININITINISDLCVNNNGTVNVCGINSNTSCPIYNTSITNFQNNPSIINFNPCTFVNSSPYFNLNPCLMTTSFQRNKEIPANYRIYLGLGQTDYSGSFTSNLWYSDDGKIFNAIIPTLNNAKFLTVNTNVISIIKTCVLYEPDINVGTFQYVVCTQYTDNKYYLTFCTENDKSSNPTIYNNYGSYVNIYGIDYCPTINFLVVIYNNGTSSNICIDLFDCSDPMVAPVQKTVLSTSPITIPATVNSSGVKYIGKQLLFWINNIIYSLVDIKYKVPADSESLKNPLKVTFENIYNGQNITNII